MLLINKVINNVIHATMYRLTTMLYIVAVRL